MCNKKRQVSDTCLFSCEEMAEKVFLAQTLETETEKIRKDLKFCSFCNYIED